MFDDETETYRRQAPGLSPFFVSEKSGVVFTKAWVVDLLLDLVGYKSDKDLSQFLLVEPAAGTGSFLMAAVGRLIESCKIHGRELIEARSALVAYEIDERSATLARSSLRALLITAGARSGDAEVLVDSWVRTGDYLLETRHLRGQADFVVGNPPYIRLEDLDSRGLLYRSAYKTMKGRADIYVAFFEAALNQLKEGGVCGFICADRWMFNQYGAELRGLITSRFAVELVAQMHESDAFEDRVSAYPAITMIRRTEQVSTIVATLSAEAEKLGVKRLASELLGDATAVPKTNASTVATWFQGREPWAILDPWRKALLKRLETDFPPLESTSARVGIGVATGADGVFLTRDENLVEADRMLPLAMAEDIRQGQVNHSGCFLVNPWNGLGLVDLDRYPRLRAHLHENKQRLSERHVGKKNPQSWFRTIDRVDSSLQAASKLYLPDIGGRMAPVLDEGQTYPHHNIYFIVPGLWAPKVLGGLLMSSVAQFIVSSYCVRMRGNYLRFQAQYLRRICLPYVHEVSADQAARLEAAFETRDFEAANKVSAEIFGLSDAERELIEN